MKTALHRLCRTTKATCAEVMDGIKVEDPAPLVNSECNKDMSVTIPPAVCASTPLRASSSNSTSQDSYTRLGHLKKKRKIQCDATTEDMTVQLLDSKLNRVHKESQLVDIRIKVAQTELTNARLSQLKNYYKLKQLEKDLAIPAAEGVDQLIKLDIAAQPKSN